MTDQNILSIIQNTILFSQSYNNEKVNNIYLELIQLCKLLNIKVFMY